MIKSTSKSRTLVAHASDLLICPRWIIERDVDFTHCRHGGRYESDQSACMDCRFGPGCRWLDSNRTSTIDAASLSDLVQAIDSACINT